MIFASQEHKDFFMKKASELKADTYLKTLIYTIGICPDTRSRWSSFYDEADRSIRLEVINQGWQTSGSLNVTRLAFQLFTDGTPTALTYSEDDVEHEDFRECQKYSVSDIFCCGYAPFFVQAVQLRYPEFFHQQS